MKFLNCASIDKPQINKKKTILWNFELEFAEIYLRTKTVFEVENKY